TYLRPDGDRLTGGIGWNWTELQLRRAINIRRSGVVINPIGGVGVGRHSPTLVQGETRRADRAFPRFRAGRTDGVARRIGDDLSGEFFSHPVDEAHLLV